MKLNGKWGFIDSTGKFVIPAQFDSVGNFYRGYCTISRDNNEYEGLIDYKGKVIIEPDYFYIGFVEDRMVDVMLKNERITYFNIETNKLMTVSFEEGNEFSGGLAAVMNEKEKWGFINKKGKMVTGFEFDDVDGEFINDTTVVTINNAEYFMNNKGVVLEKYSGDWRIRKIKGFKRIPTMIIAFRQAFTKIQEANSVFSGVKVDKVGPVDDSVFWFSLSNSKYGIADINCTFVVEPEYDFIGNFSEKLACVKKDNKWGFINHSGKIVVELTFERAYQFVNGLAAVKQGGFWGFIDLTGNWKIPPIFENAYSFENIYNSYYD